jgi:uncharacterized membrane protein YccF (DUF307 family)
MKNAVLPTHSEGDVLDCHAGSPSWLWRGLEIGRQFFCPIDASCLAVAACRLVAHPVWMCHHLGRGSQKHILNGCVAIKGEGSMRALGNILWHFPFFGFVQAALIWLFGLLLTVTVVAAPIGIGLMEYGKFLFAPFGRAMVSKADLNAKQNTAWRAYSTVVMILYLPFGLILAAVSVVQVALLFLSIIGIPVALVVARSLGTMFNPVNKKCVPIAVAEELDRRAAGVAIAKHLGT